MPKVDPAVGEAGLSGPGGSWCSCVARTRARVRGVRALCVGAVCEFILSVDEVVGSLPRSARGACVLGSSDTAGLGCAGGEVVEVVQVVLVLNARRTCVLGSSDTARPSCTGGVVIEVV